MKKNNVIFFSLFLIVLVLLLLAYSNHFHNSFHFDDYHTIVNNAFIRDIKNIPVFFADAKAHSALPANQTYRPLTSVTFAIDYWLGRGTTSTFFFHLSTFIWFVALCVMLYFFYDKLFSLAAPHRWNRFIALFGAGWFALHTVNAETVNYIYQRGDILSTCMVIAGFILYAYLPEWRRWHIYLVPFTIGIFFKEPAVMFAPLLFFYIMLFENHYSLAEGFQIQNLPHTLKKSAPALALCLTLAIFVVCMMSAAYTPGGTSRFAYLITQPFVIFRYFVMFFLPIDLSADTDWRVLNMIRDTTSVAAGFLFIFLMLYLAWAASKKKETRPVSFGILWFFFALAPTSSFVPLAEVTNDHRVFFPFIGLMLAVCWAVGRFIIKYELVLMRSPVWKASLFLLLSAILAGHAYGTYQRNIVWHTDESLWLDVTRKSPDNGRGLMNYGLTQMGQGKYENASLYFNKALVLLPEYAYLHINIGILKGAMNQPKEAETYFKNALRLNPQLPDGYYFYASWLAGHKREQEAIPLLQRALQISPAYAGAKPLLDTLLAQNKIPADLHTEQTAAERLSTADDYISKSLRDFNSGNFSDCIQACTEALKLKPDDDRAYKNICASYNALHEWEKAIDACEKGFRINPDNLRLDANLAIARHQQMLQGQTAPNKPEF